MTLLAFNLTAFPLTLAGSATDPAKHRLLGVDLFRLIMCALHAAGQHGVNYRESEIEGEGR